MKVLQVNTTVNSGSHGKIAEQIAQIVLDKGGKSFFAFGRDTNDSRSEKYKIGTSFDLLSHVFLTRFFDLHGSGSILATKKFIGYIERISPDIIHLHNIHGYYLNIDLLFTFLKNYNKPVVWTLHDCWPFTGHCAFYEYVGCEKWKKQCYSCEQLHSYPKSLIVDNSSNNFSKKERIFNGLNKLYLVPVSDWLDNELSYSFLSKIPRGVIKNGIDVDIFRPIGNYEYLRTKHNLGSRRVILGVASTWESRKGFSEFLKLSNLIDAKYTIVLIGLSKIQLKNLPDNVLGIERTENTDELAAWYSFATVFFNPTLEDNFPTTNLEAIACGTPVVTYRTGGSGESISSSTGFVIEKGDLSSALAHFEFISTKPDGFYTRLCREYALRTFDKNSKFRDYVDLYQFLLNK